MKKLIKRQEAIKWWKELDGGDRLRYWCSYCEKYFSPSKRPEELTGREIEKIKQELNEE
jgi:hypothetical protein